jgi:hypothetical protein
MKHGFHASKLHNSPAQQRIWRYLQFVGASGATTLEISANAAVQNVATWVSHLRKNDCNVVCEYSCMLNGSRIYRYWLAEFRQREVA